MSSATQITIVRGRKGLRSSKSFILGVTSCSHREAVYDILEQNTLIFIEHDDVDGGMELAPLRLTLALRGKSTLIDAIADEGLRQPFQELRDYWLSLADNENAFAIAELVC